MHAVKSVLVCQSSWNHRKLSIKPDYIPLYHVVYIYIYTHMVISNNCVVDSDLLFIWISKQFTYKAAMVTTVHCAVAYNILLLRLCYQSWMNSGICTELGENLNSRLSVNCKELRLGESIMWSLISICSPSRVKSYMVQPSPILHWFNDTHGVKSDSPCKTFALPPPLSLKYIWACPFV